MHCKDGKNLLIRNTLIPLRNSDGEITRLLSVFMPVSDGAYDQKLVRDIYEVATRDPLTCLPGRKYMESCIREEIVKYQRTGHPFAVMFADVNNLHKINNLYGHNAGDVLLRSMGLDFRKFGRQTDRFCRWGGDEFVGLLQLRNAEDVKGAAKRFGKLSSKTEIEIDGKRIVCQASIGITVVRSDDDANSIISRADRYMYLAKERDDDRVVTDENASGDVI